jgi:hypothetical protein
MEVAACMNIINLYLETTISFPTFAVGSTSGAASTVKSNDLFFIAALSPFRDFSLFLY